MVIRSTERIAEEVQTLFNEIESGPVLIYTDLKQIGFIPEGADRQEQLEIIWSIIRDAAEERTLLLPTFNYSYLEDGRYNVYQDKCEVGVLNEYVRSQYPRQRTLTPVFNFCILNDMEDNFSTGPHTNPFSKESTYGEFVEKNGVIVNLGTEFFGLTHYTEEQMDVPYRYYKHFPGQIIKENKVTEFKLNYRVRPLINNAVQVDHASTIQDLRRHNIADVVSIGNAQVTYYSADEALDFVYSQMKTDKHYLLDDKRLEKLNELYERYEKPLTYEKVEG